QQLSASIVAQGGSQSSTINRAAIKAITKLISTCGIGVWAGKAGLLDQNALSVLSRLIFNLFQPCLLFVNVASTLAALSSGSAGGAGGSALYMLPIAAAIQILVGFTVGKIMTTLVYGQNGADSENAKQLLACTSFANTGPLPLLFTDALFCGHANPALLQNSVAYISMYLLGWSPVFWIVAPGILSEDKADAKKPKWCERSQFLCHSAAIFVTLLLYLSDMENADAGGETSFPKGANRLGFKAHAGKGNAILFYNLLESSTT
ncbi:hypothetical protein B484DRAFT_405443, partial [Ochromonadaceae sp. CCMP2298]